MYESLIILDRKAGPLPEQIYRAIGEAVRSGRLAEAASLPSSRQLAAELGVSRNSVNGAYELLRAAGIISVRRGAAPEVAARAPLEGAGLDEGGLAPKLSARGTALSVDLRGGAGRRAGRLEPGAPDGSLFPADHWARLLRRVARRSYGSDAIYSHVEGLPALREALAGHLNTQRGVLASPAQILVLPSIQAGLTLVSQCLAEAGDVGWVESPGYFGARTAFAAAGLDVCAIEVDAEGADPASLAGGPDPRLIYLTPSHQYPTGVRMSLQRRLDVLALARRTGAVIVEDDYDSEFLWEGRAISALQGISRGDEVVYLGTTAKSLLPGLRLAYMVVPEALAPAFIQAQRNLGMRVNIHTQAALAEFIGSGAFATHLNRIAKHYEMRGRLLIEKLRARFGGVLHVEMPMGGLQAVAHFLAPVDDAAIAGALGEAGFETPALSSYCAGKKRRGLIIGFADATEARLERFSDQLATALHLT